MKSSGKVAKIAAQSELFSSVNDPDCAAIIDITLTHEQIYCHPLNQIVVLAKEMAQSAALPDQIMNELTRRGLRYRGGRRWTKTNFVKFCKENGISVFKNDRLIYTKKQKFTKENPRFTKADVLRWIDDFHERTGKWPDLDAGTIDASTPITWRVIHDLLSRGGQGVEKDCTLAAFVARERGIRNRRNIPPLTSKLILSWADKHFHDMRKWPTGSSGSVRGVPNENWNNLDVCLRSGLRGLPGGSSLAQLLERHRGRPNPANTAKLTEREILELADKHVRKTGKSPNTCTGEVIGLRGVRWKSIDEYLRAGVRGLPGGSSLNQLLAEHGLVKRRGSRPVTIS